MSLASYRTEVKQDISEGKLILDQLYKIGSGPLIAFIMRIARKRSYCKRDVTNLRTEFIIKCISTDKRHSTLVKCHPNVNGFRSNIKNVNRAHHINTLMTSKKMELEAIHLLICDV